MKKGKSSFTPLSTLVKQELGRMANGKIKNIMDLEKSWGRIVGESVSQNSRVLFCKNKTLHVGVSHSSWMFELSLMKTKILQEIQNHLPELVVTDIKFKVTS